MNFDSEFKNEFKNIYYEIFKTEDEALNYFIELLYPDGIECPVCSSHKVQIKRSIYWCSKCYHNFSVFHNTIFWHTRLDIRKWFYVIRLMMTEKNVMATRIRAELDISYKSAWRMRTVISRGLLEKKYRVLFAIISNKANIPSIS